MGESFQNGCDLLLVYNCLYYLYAVYVVKSLKFSVTTTVLLYSFLLVEILIGILRNCLIQKVVSKRYEIEKSSARTARAVCMYDWRVRLKSTTEL